MSPSDSRNVTCSNSCATKTISRGNASERKNPIDQFDAPSLEPADGMDGRLGDPWLCDF